MSHQPDEATVKYEPKFDRSLPEIATYLAVCVDYINLGRKVADYPGSDPYVAEAGALVFQIDADNPDTGKPFEIAQEFTLSLGKKANLRKLLENLRGRGYTEDELEQAKETGIKLHKVVGVSCLLGVTHKTSQAGNTRAVISSVAPLMKGMDKMIPENYTRSEWWAKKKAEYEEGAAKFYEKNPPKTAKKPDLPTYLKDDDDDLPF